MALYNVKKVEKLHIFSSFSKIIVKKFLINFQFKKINKFISPSHVKQLVKYSNLSFFFSLIVFLFQLFFFKFALFIMILITLFTYLTVLEVFALSTVSSVLKEKNEFDEQLFLYINALSISMATVPSLPYALSIVNTFEIQNSKLQEFQKKLLFLLNLNYDDKSILEEEKNFFENEKYQLAFSKIMSQETFIETDPHFLNKIRREMNTIEDNISIFIAFSSLLPLVLSLIVSLILPSSSFLIFLFPLLYSLIGSFILQFIQFSNIGEK